MLVESGPGGACEAVVGGVGGVVTAETGLGTAAGYAVLINGIDNTLSGAKQMWTGEVEQTLLHQGIAEGSKLLGADEQTAENIATYGKLFGTAGLNIANTKNILNAFCILRIVSLLWYYFLYAFLFTKVGTRQMLCKTPSRRRLLNWRCAKT